eukprot:3716347-Lingulodinium_polyedra.AAC.1
MLPGGAASPGGSRNGTAAGGSGPRDAIHSSILSSALDLRSASPGSAAMACSTRALHASVWTMPPVRTPAR